jgi:hypothetical protein
MRLAHVVKQQRFRNSQWRKTTDEGKNANPRTAAEDFGAE